MKRIEFLLIALMAICTLLNACVKKNGGTALTANEDPYSQINSYNNNTVSLCSSQMIYQYQEMIYVCNVAYTWEERRECRYLIRVFINQYPQINCVNETNYNYYNYKSSKPQRVTISAERLRNKLKQMK